MRSARARRLRCASAAWLKTHAAFEVPLGQAVNAAGGPVALAPLSVVRQYIEQQNRPVQGTARALAALPARAFTPALKGGALARIPVAAWRRCGPCRGSGARAWGLPCT